MIVLLDAESRGAPSSAKVVQEINGGRPAPGALPIGNPSRADFGITWRARGDVAKWLLNHPDSAMARLQRYVILEYPPNANLDAIATALRRHPHVLHVELDIAAQFSTVTDPNDPFLMFDPNPSYYQWGHYMLNIPAAWELTGGHGYVGLADSGAQIDHPDLRAFHSETIDDEETWIYDGGNLRTHLAWDFGDDDENVDELGPSVNGTIPPAAGHGTHVAGLIAATGDNGEGVAGVCQHCSVIPNKVMTQSFTGFISNTARALTAIANSGLQVASLSLGFSPRDCNSTSGSYALACTALEFVQERQIVVAAASGNSLEDIDFPANDPRVMAIGGIDPLGAFWDDSPNCPLPGTKDECGSNYMPSPGGDSISLVAPAKSVISSIYEGQLWSVVAECGDIYNPSPGYGPCTGTSMAAPYVAGIAGLLRSIDPLVSEDKIRQILETTASLGFLEIPDPKLGFGAPDGFSAARKILGTAGDQDLSNRLTPLFSLYSNVATSHLYTTVPQAASAAIFDCQAPFVSEGPEIAAYSRFPGVNEEPCPFSGCSPILPRAAVYVFSTHTPPFEDQPPLVPLYKLSYDPDRGSRCGPLGSTSTQVRRGYFYTTDETLLPSMKASGYELDGREGYIFDLCSPESTCIPDGAVRLYRLYHPAYDDWALFPENELVTWQAKGYVSMPGLAAWIGYTYPNQDSDFDGVVDGFEYVAGTDPHRTDSDCDSLNDGQELLGYVLGSSATDPSDENCPISPGDPIFSDDFERGNLLTWFVFDG